MKKQTISHCKERVTTNDRIIQKSSRKYKSLSASWIATLCPKGRAAFTLVELIVVITILAILGMIAFLSFQSYTGSARDSVRLEDMSNMSKAITLYSATSGNIPFPDSYVTVTASGYSVLQGTAGKNVLSNIKMSDAKDNLDGTYYSYSTDVLRTHYTIGGFLESADNLAINSDFIPSVYAIDYTKRFLQLKGDSVGIITESGAFGITPIEQSNPAGTVIDLTNTPKSITLNISKTNSITGSGQILGIIQSLQNGSYRFSEPKTCPIGFIPVPGNSDFNQPGFCVMKYEAKAQSGTINSLYNGHNYTVSDTIVSNAGDVPIVTVTQLQAIAACKTIGAHLITEDEWMTLTRNIEANPTNWSGNAVGSGYLYSGHNDNSPATALNITDASDPYNQTGNSAVSGPNQKRTLTLSNGNIIWDLAGNVWEHVNKINTIDGTNYAVGTNGVLFTSPKIDMCNATDGYYEWTACNATNARVLYGPSVATYNSANGVGGVWDYDGTVFLRGGTWDSGAGTGVFTLTLTWTSGLTGSYVGFRCVL